METVFSLGAPLIEPAGKSAANIEPIVFCQLFSSSPQISELVCSISPRSV